MCRELAGVQNVYIAHCRQITDASLVNMAECLWVEELDISHLNQISDRGVLAIAENLIGVRKLNMAWSRKITDASVELIAKYCTCMTELNINGCDALSDEIVTRIIHANPQLDLKWKHQHEGEEVLNYRREFRPGRMHGAKMPGPGVHLANVH